MIGPLTLRWFSRRCSRLTSPLQPSPPSTPSQSKLADPALVELAATGDRMAQSEIVDRFKRLVYSIPRRYRLPPETCDDVFQNVFVALFRHIHQLRDPSTLTKWLMTTTHRECWRIAKRPHPQAPAGWSEQERIDTKQAPESATLQWERQARVQQALTDLGGKCEQLLRAIFLDRRDTGYETIAQELGIPIGSIGPTRARCLAKLAELLGDLE